MDSSSTDSDSGSISQPIATELAGSSSKQMDEGGMDIRMDELPRALVEDQNKLIHLDPVPDFKDKAEIKPWLQKILYPQGIEIVIERSDNIKVIFKCKASKRGKNMKLKKAVAENNSESKEFEGSCKENDRNNNNGRKKRSVSRFNRCPFRIRATFSLKRKKWNIVIVNNTHSHALKFNPDSDEYRKFKAKLRRDNDWYAVRQFDALEYRTMSNFPIDSSVIPCECGLTSEIESFSIVLPNVNPVRSDDVEAITNVNYKHINSNGIAPIINKPKNWKWQQRLKQKNREKLVRDPSNEHLFGQLELDQDCPIKFFDVPNFTDSLGFSRQQQLTDPVSDFNEIDFTDFFKPHSTILPDNYQDSQDNQLVDISESIQSNALLQSTGDFQPPLVTQTEVAASELPRPSDDDILAFPSQTGEDIEELILRNTPLLCPQQRATPSEAPLQGFINAADSQSSYGDNEDPVDDLLWKMNFENE